MEAVKLFSWFIVVLVRIVIDRKGKKYTKSGYFKINFTLAFFAFWFNVLFFLGKYTYEELDGWIMLDHFLLAVWHWTSYWLFFEGGLNIVRKRIQQLESFWKGLLYYDRKEGDSGGIAIFFAKHPKLHKPAKVLAFILFIGLTVYFLI